LRIQSLVELIGRTQFCSATGSRYEQPPTATEGSRAFTHYALARKQF